MRGTVNLSASEVIGLLPVANLPEAKAATPGAVLQARAMTSGKPKGLPDTIERLEELIQRLRAAGIMA